ncbi:MAG: hypothetical protein ACJ8J0_20870 [Longimicrobiaceae bacterium]
MPANPLFQHFWLLFLVLMLVNVAIWRSRLARLVTAGRASQAEVSRFLRGAVVAFTGYSLAAEAIVLGAGWPSALCVYSGSWSSPGTLAMLVLTGSCYLLLLWWVWAGGGADTLARLGPALGRRMREEPYSPAAVRVFVTALLAVVCAGAVINRTAVAPVPGCAAPADAAAAAGPAVAPDGQPG